MTLSPRSPGSQEMPTRLLCPRARPVPTAGSVPTKCLQEGVGRPCLCQRLPCPAPSSPLSRLCTSQRASPVCESESDPRASPGPGLRRSCLETGFGGAQEGLHMVPRVRKWRVQPQKGHGTLRHLPGPGRCPLCLRGPRVLLPLAAAALRAVPAPQGHWADPETGRWCSESARLASAPCTYQ